MNIRRLKKLAQKFDQLEWPFSAARVWKEIIVLDPSPFHQICYAEQLYLSGDYDQAEQVLKSVPRYQILPQQQCLWYTLIGRVYTEQCKFELAIDAFKKGIDVGTNETYTYVFLSALLFRLGELDEAKSVLFAALEKDGDLAEVCYNLATLYAREANFVAAADLMQRCLEIDPEFDQARAFLEDFKCMLNTHV